MLTQEEMEELRQDIMEEDRQQYQHEYTMRTDIDYFLAKSNYQDALDHLLILKSDAETYGQCIHSLCEMLRDEL